MTSSELLDKLLEKRGLHTKEDKESFLNPNYERDILDPFLMRDMEKSCERILSAIQNNEKILIYADYDCDGIPGAVILNDLFEKLNYKNFDVYIPQRNSEGYGLNTESVERMKEERVKVLITIDLGITAIEEVADAQKHGIDVIVTDHHLPHAEIPKAFAILNPKCDEYPEKMLCGAGVAFKLAQGILKYLASTRRNLRYEQNDLALPRQSANDGEYLPDIDNKNFSEHSPDISTGWDKWLLDMAGLATLSDMVPLLGENRAIAYFGMKVLKKSPRPGLKALLRKTKIAQEYLTEDDIGFMITPRLNAASRMDDPRRAFELLATKDTAEGETLANHLSNINDERKNLVKSIMRDINKKFETREHTEVIVIGNPAWKVGVLGLIAGKITDEYKRPAFVWGRDENDVIKGSCRSDGSVSVVELMTDTKEHFTEFGGHEGAGGFSVHNDKIHFLEEALCKSFIAVKKEVSTTVEYNYDLKLSLDDISMQNWKEIEKMAPFGLANPKPMFLFENIPVTAMKKFGKAEEHLEFIFTNSRGQKIKAISFFSTPESFTKNPAVGEPISLLATFDLSRFAGRVELRLRVEDIF